MAATLPDVREGWARNVDKTALWELAASIEDEDERRRAFQFLVEQSGQPRKTATDRLNEVAHQPKRLRKRVASITRYQRRFAERMTPRHMPMPTTASTRSDERSVPARRPEAARAPRRQAHAARRANRTRGPDDSEGGEPPEGDGLDHLHAALAGQSIRLERRLRRLADRIAALEDERLADGIWTETRS